MTDRELINLALEAMETAYAPYSGFSVGAALECSDGSVFLGCNVENAAYGESICAERTALVKAVSEGRRSFRRMAVAARSEQYCMPCGSCRQETGGCAGISVRRHFSYQTMPNGRPNL